MNRKIFIFNIIIILILSVFWFITGEIIGEFSYIGVEKENIYFLISLDFIVWFISSILTILSALYLKNLYEEILYLKEN
jgi:hypothetical protein